MKKYGILLALVLFLSGCGAQPVFETVEDEPVDALVASQQSLTLQIPKDAVQAVMESADVGKIYLCDGYSIAVQTLPAGDLDSTLRAVCGFSREKLAPVCTKGSGFDKYECVWSCAGEAQDQIGRTCILDDGSYHYCVTLMADASQAGALANQWQSLIDSVSLDSINTAQ